MAVNVKGAKFGALTKSIRDIRSELKKVIWPTWPQLVQSTITVLFACLLIGSAIWLFDLLCGKVFTLVFSR